MISINNKYTCSRSEFVFYIGFGLFMLANMFDLALTTAILNGSKVFVYIIKMARYGAYAVCFSKIIMDTIYEKQRFWKIFFAVLLTGVSYVVCLNKTMILASIVLLSAEKMSSRKAIKIVFILQSFTLLLMVFLSQSGLIADYIWEPEIRPRHFLGFSWVTTSAVLYFFIILEYIYLKCGKLNLLETCILFMINIWLYYMTDSRMVFLLSTVVLIFFFLFYQNISKSRSYFKIKKIIHIMPMLLCGFAIGIHAFYNPENKIYSKINSLLSGRLRLGKNALSDYGISLFGHKIEWVGFSVIEHLDGEYNYVDCSYLQILLEYGLIFLIIVLMIYSIVIKSAIIMEHNYLVWIILFVLIFSITEPRLVNFMYNPFPILCITETSFSKIKILKKAKDKCYYGRYN